MIEYKVQALETGGTADIEKVCNDLARDGWRLVSTAAANAGGTAVRAWLFFEREASRPSMPDEDMARLAAQFATSATR
jgi:Domain of unknown function (DUF4177)